MKRAAAGLLSAVLVLALSACAGAARADKDSEIQNMPTNDTISAAGAAESYTVDTPIADVISDPAFEDYGRLIFPVNSVYYRGSTLGGLQLTWYSNIAPDKTVEIANYMKDYSEAEDKIF